MLFCLQKFTNVVTPDKKVSQKIGLRLRNLLKLPKAHKWCIYEWFYSNIDRQVAQLIFFFYLCRRMDYLMMINYKKVFWCYLMITPMVVWKMKCSPNMLRNCVSVSESVILLLSHPAFQTALWGGQWVLSVSQRVIPQPENTKVDKGRVGHNQKTDGKTATVRYIFNNPY